MCEPQPQQIEQQADVASSAPHYAFNAFVTQSILVLDVCQTQAITCSAWIPAAAPSVATACCLLLATAYCLLLAHRHWEQPLRRLEAVPPPLAAQAAEALDSHPPVSHPPMMAFEYTHGACKRTAHPDAAPQVAPGDREIQIRSSWGALLEDGVRARPRRIEGDAARKYAGADAGDGARLLVLEGLFSEGECAALLQAADAVGFGRTNYSKCYRGNLRLITVDESLTAATWARLRESVPASLTAWPKCPCSRSAARVRRPPTAPGGMEPPCLGLALWA